MPLVRRLSWIAIGFATAVVVAALLVWVVSLARASGGATYGGDVAVSA